MKETATNSPAKTIVECISNIVNNTEELGLCKELFQTSGSELEYVSTMMNISERQALIFSLFANEGVDGCFVKRFFPHIEMQKHRVAYISH